ncbi:Ribosomal large subunit pseudouridine synthase D [Stieleria neptunia]|uniref:Ribosomal large subunit pseudouridine synthase D n=1 Tax=Stieleria neptunia TaxID=2527979 RepID=A0A518HL15_9BACT|nr:RluA family pseudouridine synthase [Stieleria neptunia]QDV41536.1 Ribosomal large subunit pseudouridine synthase D [Stieleria neptunia]
MKVLYEDNHLLVVDKPAGMPTMGAEPGIQTVHGWATDYLKRRYQKPGNVFVGVVSRLDQLTTGALVLARTSKAASRLAIQFGGPGKSKKVSTRARKLYLAMIAGDLEKDSGLPRSGTLTDSVFKDDAAHRMRVARHHRSDAQEARLNYCVIDRSAARTLVAVRLLTGRKHQIRLQFADRGHPILGDTKYGSRSRFPCGVALHSWRLLIEHPTKSEMRLFRAPIPSVWQQAPFSVPSESSIESTLVADADWYDEESNI